ncbi:hypothetical protein [Filomicrobium insigne]|uniref:hypothetical protein n=1 Tax=Filomicrobium insigne TaxID=418854 RepID=UPI001113FDAD|nr:hypothetical protein [Filomicrobium insigne]
MSIDARRTIFDRSAHLTRRRGGQPGAAGVTHVNLANTITLGVHCLVESARQEVGHDLDTGFETMIEAQS